jgi:hypothetical protein
MALCAGCQRILHALFCVVHDNLASVAVQPHLPVGGIYTVIKSKVPESVKSHGERYW